MPASLVPALALGDEEAGVVRVRGPVQGKANGPAWAAGRPADGARSCPGDQRADATRCGKAMTVEGRVTADRAPLQKRERRPGQGTASSRGPASFTGMSRIRFRGSVVGPHSQRSCAPRRRYSVGWIVASAHQRPRERLCRPVTAWTEVGDRVFVRRYGFYDQNIGVVLGDEAACSSTRDLSHRQAEEIRADLRELTPLPVGLVVNTHGHGDHASATASSGRRRSGARALRPISRRPARRQRDAAIAAIPGPRGGARRGRVDPPDRTFAESATVEIDPGGRRGAALPRPRPHGSRHRRHRPRHGGLVRRRPARERRDAILRRRLSDGLARDGRGAGRADRGRRRRAGPRDLADRAFAGGSWRRSAPSRRWRGWHAAIVGSRRDRRGALPGGRRARAAERALAQLRGELD